MKKTLMIVTALVLCITLLIMPLQVAAAAEEKKTVYISEVRVGMGETSEEAAKELLAEGFTILTDSDGSYSDLNYRTGTNSGLKKGPTEKIVYLGYKTTTNSKQAITDLAVMNMNGGYSIEDYNILMENRLSGEIIPFVNRFIATLNEYRANLKKPKNSLNYIRADYYRQMLNKLTDDDTGGKPIGDLLTNETKYEMGDDKYNALSDAEKKTHADILTMLMQGNGRAIILIETLIAKASDDSDDTWLDRFLETSTEELRSQVKKENPSLTTEADILSEFDKLYNDSAKKLLEKWNYFTEAVNSYDDTVNEVSNADITISDDLEKRAEKLSDDELTVEDFDTAVDVAEKQTEVMTTMIKGEQASVIGYLDSIEYEDGSVLDFFSQDRSEFAGEGIRRLYPMAASLSAGQIAALDFLSLQDLFAAAITNEEGYDTLDIDEVKPASIFQDVDREIYESGGVALTNAALRNKQNKKDTDEGFALSELGVALWIITGMTGIATITTIALNQVFVKLTDKALNTFANCKSYIEETATMIMNEQLIEEGVDDIGAEALTLGGRQETMLQDLKEVTDAASDAAYYSKASTVTKYLGIGLTFLAAALAAYSLYNTISEMLDYYKVTFTPIPRYIVDEADITETVNGVEKVINNQTAYYKVVRCNRKEGSSDVEKDNYRVLGTANDLNGDVGKQWLALYSVKYKYGRPILANSLMVQKGSDSLPKGYETGIHRFGEGAAFNLTSEYYCYNDKPEGTYVYFKNDTETVETMTTTGNSILDQANTTGALISTGYLALAGGLGIMLGAGIAALIMFPIMKKKRETAEAE